MKNSIFLWAVAVIVALTSCSKENAAETSDAKSAAQFTAGIQTRATGTDWATDDAIGIYMKTAEQELAVASIAEGVDNFKYTTLTGNSTFTPIAEQIAYFPIDGSAVDFIAYYPYKETITDYSYPIDVASQADQPVIDLMYSGNATGKTKMTPQVALSFDHKLSSLIVNLSVGNGLTEEDLTGVTVKITGQKTEGMMSLATGVITPSATQEADQTIDLKMTDAMGEAIILPAAGMEGRQLIITIATGEVFKWNIPAARDFTSGSKYVYNVTLNRTGLEVTATINPWTDGNDGGSEESAE